MINHDEEEFAKELANQFKSPGDQTYLMTGVVTSVDRPNNQYTALVQGGTIPAIKALRSVTAKVGDTVEILKHQGGTRIIGVIGTPDRPLGMLGYAVASNATSGVSSGLYAISEGSGVQSVAVDTTQRSVSLGVANVPTTPGRLLSIRWQLWSIGGTSTEWYFYTMVRVNGGTAAMELETRTAPPGLINAPSPQSECLYKTPAGMTTIGASIECKLLMGMGTIYRYSPNQHLRSQLIIEDVGPA